MDEIIEVCDHTLPDSGLLNKLHGLCIKCWQSRCADAVQECDRLKVEVNTLLEYRQRIAQMSDSAHKRLTEIVGEAPHKHGAVGGIIGDLLCLIEYLNESGTTRRRRR